MASPVDAGAELERACDLYLNSYREALPRIARRGFQPIIDALNRLLDDSGEDTTVIFHYPVENGLRAPSTSKSNTYGVLVWSKRRNTFGFAVSKELFRLGHMTLQVGLEGYRAVSMEDIVELGVKPWEIAEFLKQEAVTASFYTSMKNVTQPVAKA